MTGNSRPTSDAAHWAIALAPVLTFDAYLVATGRDSLSTRAGRHPGVTIGLIAYLACHLLSHPRWLHHVDPLHHAASAISRRR